MTVYRIIIIIVIGRKMRMFIYFRHKVETDGGAVGMTKIIVQVSGDDRALSGCVLLSEGSGNELADSDSRTICFSEKDHSMKFDDHG